MIEQNDAKKAVIGERAISKVMLTANNFTL